MIIIMSRPAKRNPLLSDHDRFDYVHVGSGMSGTDNDPDYIRGNETVIRQHDERARIPASYVAPYDRMTIPAIINDRILFDAGHGAGHGAGSGPGTDPDPNTVEMRRQDRERYDPMTDYLSKNGLLDRDNHMRYTVHYVNLNSSSRQLHPTLETDRTVKLGPDPLQVKLADGRYRLRVHAPGYAQSLAVGDNVTLTGIPSRTLLLRTRTQEGASPFQFVTGSEYLTIIADNVADVQSELRALRDVDTNATESDLFVRLNGFQSATNFVGNIPINTLNRRHRILLSLPNGAFDPRVIYIRLCRPFRAEGQCYVFPTAYNVTLTYDYVIGIPLNRLNCQGPHPQTHTITDVDTDSFCLDLNRPPGSLRRFGGGNVTVAKVIRTRPGYPSPAQYCLNLDKVYSNVVQVSLVSTEFPKTGPAVRARMNNALCWEILEDGGHVYRVEVPPGTYTADRLVRCLNRLVCSVPRITSCASECDGMCHMSFEIEPDTNVVTVRNFRRSHLRRPIVNVTPTGPGVQLQMRCTNHGLVPGDVITITGSLPHLGIPVEVIDGDHTICSVETGDLFTIKLAGFNYLDCRDRTDGGTITMLSPLPFRLRLDHADSLGRLLGFRDVGTPGAITEYGAVVTNGTPYETDGGPHPPCGILLSGPRYILMECDQLTVIGDISSDLSHVFAKIQLDGEPGTILYNTFVPTPKFLYSPIPQLSRLDIRFRAPDGELYDFNGMDHSFTLKIITAEDHPKGTSLSTDIG